MTGCLALAAALLSSCGVGMLVLDVRSGVGGWDNLLWQVAGCVAGVSCFVALARSASNSDPPPARVRAPVAAVLLQLPGWEAPDFGIGRPLVAEVIRFAAVIVVVTLVTWRSCGRKRDHGPTTLDLWVVLLPVFALAFCALCLGSLSAAVAIIVVTAVMLRCAGHRWGDALQPILVSAVFLVLLVLPRPHVRARVAYSVRQTIAARLEAPERTFAGALMCRRDLGAIYRPSLFDLPPRVARQLAIASIVGVTGYLGASAVAALFGVVGWVGFRCARDAAALKVRVMVAGMTATLVVPAALHMLGCLAFLSSHGGPLAFVSYGPGELVLAWTALGFVAGARPEP